MALIAAQVDIGASALYRHAPSKQFLLERALDTRLRAFEAAAEHGTIAALVPVSIEHRDLGVLWQRERQHLNEQARQAFGLRLRALATQITTWLPDGPGPSRSTRAWAVLAVLSSISYHSQTTPGLTELLTELAEAVPAQLPAADIEPAPDPRAPESTDVRILYAATELFGQRGFGNVSMTDLGAAVGIAGPSIYHHYASKADVLTAVLTRASGRLFAEAERVLADGGPPTRLLAGLVRSYTAMAMREPAVIEALLSEVPRLPPAARTDMVAAQHRYVDLWTQQLPGLPAAEALIRVHAALTIVNDIARTTAARRRHGVSDAAALSWAVLGATPGSHMRHVP
jgi:AcrR family transcriptional regulator